MSRGLKDPAPLPGLTDPTQVRPTDLKKLAVLHDMLRVLNDSLAGAEQISTHVQRLPVLRARVARRFQQLFRGRDVPDVRQQLARIGNREFERILLQLLEDLTELKADLEDKGR